MTAGSRKTTAGRSERAAGDGAGGGAGAGGAAPLPTSYEQARDELATVVAALEEGGLTLDESLLLWERGRSLAAACETFLAGARARVEAALAGTDDRGDDLEG